MRSAEFEICAPLYFRGVGVSCHATQGTRNIFFENSAFAITYLPTLRGQFFSSIPSVPVLDTRLDSSKLQLTEVSTLLSENYVESDEDPFRIDYDTDILAWYGRLSVVLANINIPLWAPQTELELGLGLAQTFLRTQHILRQRHLQF